MGPPTRLLADGELRRQNAQRSETDVMEKDDTEIQLEKMLFGDEPGFMNSLVVPATRTSTALARTSQKDESDIDDDADDHDIEDVPDEELFFLDAGTEKLPDTVVQDLKEVDNEDQGYKRPPIWVDSDDERTSVSLASSTRLRKLRDTEDDDIVSGTEYIRRLRRQYERLHPTPEWVKYAYKKRRLNDAGAASDEDSDVSVDSDTLLSSTKPLSDLLRSAGGFTRSNVKTNDGHSQRQLRPEILDIQRVKDVTGSGPSSIDTMQFHPYFPLLLSGGPSSTVNLYHISPQPPNPNPLVTSLHLRNTPLHTASFCRPVRQESGPDIARDATRIFLSSRRRYFHTWSLATGVVQKVSRPIYGSSRHDQKTMEAFKLSPCGRYMGLVGSGKKGGGTVNVLSTETMQWICACRIDSGGGVADFAWWKDGNGFAVVGKNGEVSEFDVNRKRVVCRWLDEGAIGTTTIALGGQIAIKDLGGDRWVAIGSSSGVVNIYDRREWSGGTDNEIKTPQRPKPTRTFEQLTTPTSYLEFSSDGQMMVMGSRWKKDALRLVHLPSCTVYRNWPTDKTPLGKISSVALSIDGGYLAVANEQGKIRLFQIRS